MNVTQLLEKDGGEFISAAYLALLHRTADPVGGQNYLRMLCAGTSKLEILHSIYASAECNAKDVNVAGLVDALAGLSVALASRSTPSTNEQHVEEPFAIADVLAQEGDAFIAAAYQALLGRPVDQAGLVNYRQRVMSGASKVQVLFELCMSAEYEESGVEPEGIHEALAKERLSIGNLGWPTFAERRIVACRFDQLLNLQGSNFVRSAYMTLLGREPDRSELNRHLGDLHSGCSKLQMLSELCTLDNVKPRLSEVHGLLSALKMYKLGRLPIVGPLIRFLTNAEGNSVADIRLRALEQQVFWLGQQLSAKIVKVRKI